jgi:hypothetical protein
MRRMTVAGALLAMTALSAAACGDDDGGGGGSSSDRGEEYVDAIMESGEDSGFTEEEDECVARAYVDVIGVDELEEAGTPEEISEAEDESLSESGITLDDEQRDVLWDEFNECVDVRQIFLGSLEAGEDLPEDAIACLDDAIDDDLLKRIFLTTVIDGDEALSNDEELNNEFLDVIGGCQEALEGA